MDGVHVVLPILVVAGLFVYPLGDAPAEPATTELFAHCAVAVVPFLFAHQPLGVLEAPGVRKPDVVDFVSVGAKRKFNS